MDYVPRKGKTVVIARSSFGGAPPAWFGLTFVLAGIGIAALFSSVVSESSPAESILSRLLGTIPVILFGGLFTGAGVWALYLRKDIARTLTGLEVSARLGVSMEELREAAYAQGVRPRYNINDVDYYRPADFDDTSLLRASVSPVLANQLLRTANAEDASGDLLLRAEQAASPGYKTPVEEEHLVEIGERLK